MHPNLTHQLTTQSVTKQHREAAQRHALAKALRRTVKEAANRHQKRHGLDAALTARWCWTPLLHDRAAAVRPQLLEIAALLDQANDPDPACIKDIDELLTNGNSPLYHPSIHISELHAILYYLRAGLLDDHAAHPRPPGRASVGDPDQVDNAVDRRRDAELPTVSNNARPPNPDSH
jgi:hypothetical protein